MIVPETANILFKKTHPDARLPVYASQGAAGADVFSVVDCDILPGRAVLIKTGLRCEIPDGWELQVRPRSGLALKHGVSVLNGPGTVDSVYRGELGVILMNHGKLTFTVSTGDRIAQIVLAPVWRARFGWTEDLSATERGSGGFGSTGV